jgi:hypothetical protein
VRIIILAVLAGLALASCAQNTAPSYTGAGYQEPGFTAYCKAHPGVGTCP